MKDFYTVIEFAKLLGFHQETIRRNIRKGNIQAFKMGTGRAARYRIPLTEPERMALFNLKEYLKGN